ncbi:hypothetical protein L873DRAFT_289675 [Choiromyces venosus 120613-1]|uniref:Uncharacterized protein n=1 Tax=Choiromyces venosus 120613-1 TaxID=1336337 RepID=A0A3N4J0L4_9PEZI|nr:hypothetical protein L873DRAFT_289675 [Choiromyces venosus 120613-1]
MDLEWDEVVEDIAGGARRNENTAVAVHGKALGDETGGLPPGLIFPNFPERVANLPSCSILILTLLGLQIYL